MRRSSKDRVVRVAVLLALASVGPGCVLAPRGFAGEQSRASAAGKAFERPVAERQLPELSAEPGWREVLQRAFLANGELESAFYEWQAALDRVNIAAGYPNSNVSLGFEYAFSSENMKGWDRARLNVGFDSMQNLSFPSKVAAAGRVALEDARAAGRRFEAAKFGLQRDVLTTYLDYALAAEKIRIHHAHAELLKVAVDTAVFRVQTGAAQQDLLKAQLEFELADNELRDMEAELPQQRAALNALMGRLADAPVAAPAALPAARPIPADDARLLAVAVDNNPELAALAHEAAGRRDALELARLQYIPDFNPFAGFQGSIEQVVGTMVTLPTTIVQIRAAVREARAMLYGSEARLRQGKFDRGAGFVAALYALRNNDRQAALFEQHLLPLADMAVSASRQAYTRGQVGITELIDSQRTLLDIRLLIAEARVAREKRLAEIESLAGVDVETLGDGPGQAVPAESARISSSIRLRAQEYPPTNRALDGKPNSAESSLRRQPESGIGDRVGIPAFTGMTIPMRTYVAVNSNSATEVRA